MTTTRTNIAPNDVGAVSGASRLRLTTRLQNSPAALRAGIILLALLGWEIAARLWGNPLFMAPPSDVALAFVGLVGNGAVMLAVWNVLVACFLAFVLSVALGLLIGVPLGLNAFLRDALYPMVLLLYAVPQSPFLPLLTIAFGTGIEPKIAYGFTHGIFPIIVTVVGGVQNIDRRLVVAAQSMGASRAQILRRIVLPVLTQSLFSGMRLAMAAVVLGVMLAELFVSAGGVGYFTKMFSNRFEPENLFALLVMLALIAITLNESCRQVERHYTKWRENG